VSFTSFKVNSKPNKEISLRNKDVGINAMMEPQDMVVLFSLGYLVISRGVLRLLFLSKLCPFLSLFSHLAEP